MMGIKALISPWDYDHFAKTWSKLLDFKKRTGFTNEQIREKSGASWPAVSKIFRGDEPEPTVTCQKNMDKIIEAYHINPDWIIGESQKMLSDRKALTAAEKIIMKRTKEKQI